MSPSTSRQQSRSRSNSQPRPHPYLPPRPRTHRSLPPMWAPNIFYSRGALVWHAGSIWRCDSPHTSGALALEPTHSLHLWTPVSSTASPDGSSPSYTPRLLPEEVVDEKTRAAALTEDQHLGRLSHALHDELAGATVWRVSSVGVLAYSEDGEVERIRQTAFREWSEQHTAQDWLRGARARTAAYRSGMMTPLVRWELVEGSAEIPQDALHTGCMDVDENGNGGARLHSARVWLGGGVVVGKCGNELRGRSEFTLDGRVTSSPCFEVLCGDADSVEWIPFVRQEATMPGCQPVEGGREGARQRALLVARARYGEECHPGQCLVDDSVASVAYDGEEDLATEFEILTQASLSRR